MVSFLHTSLSSAASLRSARFIPDIVCISSIRLFLLLPSPHASIIPTSYPFPFSRHMTRKHYLLFCYPLSQRQISSSLYESPPVSTRSFSSQSKRPTTSFSRSPFRRHQVSSPFLLSLSMSRNHTVSPERSLHLQFLFFVCLSFHKTMHRHFIQRYPPSYLFFTPVLEFHQGSQK